MTLAAVVLCAGKGTRMKSERAKVLHSLLGRPLCAYPVARALELGAAQVVPVVGHQADAVRQALTGLFPGAPLTFAVQAEQRGTADAVRCAEGALEGHTGQVLILYGDVPMVTTELLASLLEAQRRSGGPLALVSTLLDNPTGYGRVVRHHGEVAAIVEERDCSPALRTLRECNAGIYAVESGFLWEALRGISDQNAQGEFYLTDLVKLAALRAPGKVAVVQADPVETAGVNDRVELAGQAKRMRARINARWMREGVSMEDPDTTYIEEGVSLGADTELGPGVALRAGTVVGRGVRIGAGSQLFASRVAEGAQLRPYSVLEEAVVGPACHIGPFARLRPGTVLAEGVHLGNFVETKKARIGRGSKANHLSYLGDAEVGEGVNVGAGTITCNYDGVNKHPTVLEDGVFIGSDTQLVAPVKVGRGAYVAAGTTVTKDVPPDSLAISRAPQENKEGWVARKRARKKQAGGV
jgi:bifunctional UDP-N-acetylglucosamine pyrophosphorylase / glucosamine-1-phosphate N-acetyltransferase